MSKPSVLVVGCGSIGQRHMRSLQTLGVKDIRVWDTDPAKSGWGNLEWHLADHPTAVLVCTPPSTHVQIARQALEAGAHVFVEKPISDTLEGVASLIAYARSLGRVLRIGYNLRYDLGLRSLKERIDRGDIGRILTIKAEFGYYLPLWRPDQDWRKNYIMESGIILDASHEIDYVRWLGGEVRCVFCMTPTLNALGMEESASMVLGLESGAVAEVHVDCLQRNYVRTCKVIGEQGELTWTLNRETAPRTYELEIADFLQAVEAHGNAYAYGGATGEDALKVLKIALSAQSSARFLVPEMEYV